MRAGWLAGWRAGWRAGGRAEQACGYLFLLYLPRTYAADLLCESTRGKYRLCVVAWIDAECHSDMPREDTIRPRRTNNLAVA
ncbi:hypothetical protein DPMN_002717 [Dreissena polymorpha]|uniref:Secreted protein n=1 Tax=Dreissena polymorpha TaxID=45954 RepID=A0A9D4MP99_DREPO|nr:hypothetical protein DPMN_002717 [Dreissena polymorpha]